MSIRHPNMIRISFVLLIISWIMILLVAGCTLDDIYLIALLSGLIAAVVTSFIAPQLTEPILTFMWYLTVSYIESFSERDKKKHTR